MRAVKRSLREWLWRGTFEYDGPPLPVWRPGQGGLENGKDLLRQASDHLAELGRLAELAQEIENRQSSGAEGELRQVAKSMLPVLDMFERLMEFSRKSGQESAEFANWAKALEGTAERLARAMEKMGLTAMSCIGMEVDLALHDVVATRRTRDYTENTIVEERMKGYYFRGKLLRDAKVVIAVPA